MSEDQKQTPSFVAACAQSDKQSFESPDELTSVLALNQAKWLESREQHARATNIQVIASIIHIDQIGFETESSLGKVHNKYTN